MSDLLFIPAVLLGVGAIWGLVFLMVQARLRAAARARPIVDGTSITIPLVAAFAGFRGTPWLACAHNSLSPRLKLDADHVEVKVIRKRRRPYRLIQQVDYRTGIGTRNVILAFSDSLLSFRGNTASESLAREAIRLLRARGCPLSPRAQALLEAASSASP